MLPLPLQVLMWFSSPPLYFRWLTRVAAAEQLARLEQFRAEVQSLLNFTGQACPIIFPSTKSHSSNEGTAV